VAPQTPIQGDRVALEAARISQSLLGSDDPPSAGLPPDPRAALDPVAALARAASESLSSDL
jgi:hypothetical protein